MRIVGRLSFRRHEHQYGRGGGNTTVDRCFDPADQAWHSLKRYQRNGPITPMGPLVSKTSAGALGCSQRKVPATGRILAKKLALKGSADKSAADPFVARPHHKTSIGAHRAGKGEEARSTSIDGK